MDSTKSVITNGIEKAESRPRTGNKRIKYIVLIWLDGDIDEDNVDCSNTIKEFKRIVNNINTCTDGEQCVQFIKTISDSKVCLIISDVLGQNIVSRVHDLISVDTIFIFDNNKQKNEQWTKKWPKIQGIFTELSPISAAVKQTVEQCEQNLIPISFIPTNIGDESSSILDLLDTSFTYIQVIKEILSTIQFNEEHLDEFIFYCRDIFAENEYELDNIDELAKEYDNNKPIYWYTSKHFLYRMVNRALRSLDTGNIVRMGFFINDLHRNIQQLHSDDDKSLIVYRGQGLSKEDFEEMSKNKQNFISFNNFLSTNKNRAVSLHSAQQAAINPDLIGILFVMNIDKTQSTTPFASITDISYSHTEDEVLFSMYNVFRIGDIKSIEGNNRLYQVTLTLTSDNDKDLKKIIDRIREETYSEQVGWYRFTQLLLKINQISRAQDVYEVLLNQTIYESEKASIYYQLGWIKDRQGEYPAALKFYEKSLHNSEQILPYNHINLASSHNNIATAHYNMGDYAKALLSYEKVLQIQQQSLPSNHLNLVMSHNNIGMMHSKMGDYPAALSSYDKTLAIRQKSLPYNQLDIAASHNNIGTTYNNMGDYSEALSSYEESLHFRQKVLPANHPDLIASHSSIGMVRYNMGEYSKALSSYEKALAMQQKSLSSNHLDLAVSYNNIGTVYNNMGEYSKALSSFEKAFQIRQESLPANHPDLASSYNNFGMVHFAMGNYSKALSSYEKALEIRQESLPANHPDLADSYNNIAMVHYGTGNNVKALSSYEKSLEIKQKTFPPNHPTLGTSYNNIGMVYFNMNDYPKALSAYENALQIRKQSLTPNHYDLAMTFGHIANVYNSMGEYAKALPFCQHAIDIAQQTLPSNHPHFQWYINILQDIQSKL